MCSLLVFNIFKQVAIYFSCVGECCYTFWTSRNVLWTPKTIDNDRIFHFWMNISFKSINMFNKVKYTTPNFYTGCHLPNTNAKFCPGQMHFNIRRKTDYNSSWFGHFLSHTPTYTRMRRLAVTGIHLLLDFVTHNHPSLWLNLSLSLVSSLHGRFFQWWYEENKKRLPHTVE